MKTRQDIASSRLRVLPWPVLFAAILITKATLSLTVRHSAVAVAYNTAVYFLLLLLTTGLAIQNSRRTTQGSRIFWAFLAAGMGIWALDQWLFLYNSILSGTDVPDDSFADPALFLHVVPLMAALAVRPHLRLSNQKLQRATLNFLILLFFWVFLYAYVLYPYQYLFLNPQIYNPRFDALYLFENIALLLALGISIAHAQGPWRSIYLHLLGASTLYVLGSTLGNLYIDSGGYYNGSLYSFMQAASACWFAWVPLMSRNLAPGEIPVIQPDSKNIEYTTLFAVLAVMTILLLGVWEVFQGDPIPGMRKFRLVVVLVSVLFLALAAFLKDYLEKRELTGDIRRGRLLSQEALADARRRLITAQEEERGRIARDLHDDISQRLALLTMELDRLRKAMSYPSAKVLHRLDDIREQTVEIATDIRGLSHELHSSNLEYLGLVPAMREFCRKFSLQHGVEIVFDSNEFPRFLQKDISLCLFRVLQESIHNAAKHSGGKHYEVQLWKLPGAVQLTVTDFGAGFDSESPGNGTGLGLTSMRERVNLVNGEISIKSKPNSGTVITVRVPLDTERIATEGASAAS
jgi:signal transduction histidine kinase